MSAFEQLSFAFDRNRKEPPAPERERGKQDPSLSVATRATKLTQELRRPRPEAPKLATIRELEPTSDDEAARQLLERRIASHLPGGRLALAVTDNRYTMISVRRDTAARGGPLYRVRIHYMFVDAPPFVTRALARYIALNDGEASRQLGEYIDENQAIIRRGRQRTPAPVALETRGEFFDLQQVYDDLNVAYFGGRIEARITWGPRGGRKRRRTSIKMGSYSVEDRLIRIHPSLDRKFIPRYFLEWIVYHEMLHQVHDIPVVGGRRQFHTRAFLAEERQFAEYDRARQWERANLDRILHY